MELSELYLPWCQNCCGGCNVEFDCFNIVMPVTWTFPAPTTTGGTACGSRSESGCDRFVNEVSDYGGIWRLLHVTQVASTNVELGVHTWQTPYSTGCRHVSVFPTKDPLPDNMESATGAVPTGYWAYWSVQDCFGYPEDGDAWIRVISKYVGGGSTLPVWSMQIDSTSPPDPNMPFRLKLSGSIVSKFGAPLVDHEVVYYSDWVGVGHNFATGGAVTMNLDAANSSGCTWQSSLTVTPNGDMPFAETVMGCSTAGFTAMESQPIVASASEPCTGCEGRKETMNRILPGSGDLVEKITTKTGLKSWWENRA